MPRTSAELAKAPRAMSRAIASFEKSVGGREALVAAMLANPELDSEQRYLVSLLADPTRDKTPIGEICHDAGVHIGHVLQLFKSGRFARAQVEAIDKISAKLPAIAEDFASRAVEREVACETCAGSGETVNPDDGEVARCLICDGSGTITLAPSLERQRLALELGGLGPRRDPRAGINIGIFNPSTKEARVTAEDLRNLRVSSDKLLYPGKYGGEDTSEVVDTAEVTDAEILPKGEGKEKQDVKEALSSRSPARTATTLQSESKKSTKSSFSPLAPPGQRP